MSRRFVPILLIAFGIAAIAHLLFAPIFVQPRAYAAPRDTGFAGPFAKNDRLTKVQRLPLAGGQGPEDAAMDSSGRIYVSSRNGDIIRLSPDGTDPSVWINTGGCPLGLEFDAGDTLWVADAYRGLLSIDPQKNIQVRATQAAGIAIRYANDLDITQSGVVYFTDASTKFGAKTFGGTLPSSLLDIMEHGYHGRLLRFDPKTHETRVIRDHLSFANGVAIAGDDSALYLAETADNRILRLQLSGDHAGRWSVLIDGLPGFPDNIKRGLDGRMWVGLVAPRNKALNFSADKPFIRAMIQRLPAFLRPKAALYGHVFAFDDNGTVLQDLQDPDKNFAHVTGALETNDYLFVTSLQEPELGRLPWHAQ